MVSGVEIGAADALLVIDMQNDFLPATAGYSGALGVEGGDEIVAGIEVLAARFEHVILTQDWHPAAHVSFASAHEGKQAFVDTLEVAYGTQALWPDHCVQGSEGAALAVDIPHAEMILRKGFRREVDSYSAFLEDDHATPTGLAGYLRERGLRRLFFCGLAYDFCVASSAVDGAGLGFECVVVEDLSRAVRVAGSVERMDAALAQAGVARVQASDVRR